MKKVCKSLYNTKNFYLVYYNSYQNHNNIIVSSNIY